LYLRWVSNINKLEDERVEKNNKCGKSSKVNDDEDGGNEKLRTQ
jgi:hypothetical protein